MESIKILINKFIVAIVMSLALFYTIDIVFDVYIIIIAITWIVIFLNFSISKNVEFFGTIIIVYLGNLITYIFIKNKIYNGLSKENIEVLVIITCLIFLLTISRIIFIVNPFRKKQIIKQPQIMMKRKKDLEGLLYYIDVFDIIALNGRWGTGKSFLIKELKKEVNNKYEIIEIDVLSCNLNELQLILIKEIEELMYKNRIISKYSNKLKRFLGKESVISRVQDLIFSKNQSYSETIKGLQKELEKLGKKIIIIYEDIDRITDIDIIKNIFGISEKISNEKIKIVYQYHEDNLKEIGFTADYLEKYMPFKINLTEINFFEILSFKLNEKNYDKSIIEIKDFNFLKEDFQGFRYNVLVNVFNINKEINLVVRNISIRKVENFLSELVKILTKNQYKEHKETVIAFFFLKHFIPTIYEKLNIEKGLVETIKFDLNSNFYTITELISLFNSGKLGRGDIINLFKNEENQIGYGVLKLFDYKVLQVINEENYIERLKLIYEEPIRNLKDRDSNEKKDRLIWSLLAQGKSQFTDYEYVGRKFIEEVLNRPDTEILKAYEQFNNSLFYKNDQETDNSTIFKMGVSSFIELFKSFRILDVPDYHQVGLVNIYFKVEKIKDIDDELIQTLNYCNLGTKKGYIGILNNFNKLNVIGNLNDEECFANFLKMYIRALSSLGYINTGGFSNIFFYEKVIEYKKYVMKDLKGIIEKIHKVKHKLSLFLELKELDDEFNTIIIFIEKLIEIIDCKSKVIKKERGLITSNIYSRYQNQEEFDRLERASNEGNNLKDEIKNSYLKGKITAYEIEKLIDKLD
ncbi:KAP family P-loop domain-containing protein [Desulfonispora thiosulfatigenes DSM 11270]|uniref:KAP family P-loop domain-containing protein n=1 Tax=Desulfonispora thiosulfatigenes DSM 11270 TaxID=656914 RepID=A0A1W1V708_DESTI|nr:P-loop NTPase fold protein [Desulfonispora thiosulfatigenes]SMB88811.1 KAP family P-loop domain-containing protein [Desulfonispora thiosulfatigenes DSM 11270]